jgi:hypothetical protein
MTKESKHTILALIGFFFLLVILGTLNKTQETLVTYDSIVEDFTPSADLPVLAGDPVLTAYDLPMLVNLPEIAPVDIAELPHLTLPPLQDS